MRDGELRSITIYIYLHLPRTHEKKITAYDVAGAFYISSLISSFACFLNNYEPFLFEEMADN